MQLNLAIQVTDMKHNQCLMHPCRSDRCCDRAGRAAQCLISSIDCWHIIHSYLCLDSNNQVSHSQCNQWLKLHFSMSNKKHGRLNICAQVKSVQIVYYCKIQCRNCLKFEEKQELRNLDSCYQSLHYSLDRQMNSLHNFCWEQFMQINWKHKLLDSWSQFRGKVEMHRRDNQLQDCRNRLDRLDHNRKRELLAYKFVNLHSRL